jgi:hypothetical protein
MKITHWMRTRLRTLKIAAPEALSLPGSSKDRCEIIFPIQVATTSLKWA